MKDWEDRKKDGARLEDEGLGGIERRMGARLKDEGLGGIERRMGRLEDKGLGG